jgi:hypothetical protein
MVFVFKGLINNYLNYYCVSYFRDPKEIVRPRVPLSACIQSFAAFETVDDFYSSAIKGKTIAKK